MVPVSRRDIPHPLLLQPNTPSRCLVQDTCFLSTTQVLSTRWDTLSARRRAGLSSPAPRSGSDHSFTSGLFSSRVAPEPHYFYTAFNRKLYLLHLSQYLLSCHSAYLQVLHAFPKKPLHGQRDLKCLLSALITTDQEMRIIHVLATHRLKSA